MNGMLVRMSMFASPAEVWCRRLAVVAGGLAALVLGACPARALSVKDYAVMLTASVQTNPLSITLAWLPHETPPAQYRVFRKLRSDADFGAPVALLSGGPLPRSFVDTNVLLGVGYEYKVDMGPARSEACRYGLIYSGAEISAVEFRGTILLVVERSVATNLATELDRLQQDLVGDGWSVVRRDVGRNDTVASVKQVILDQYQLDPQNVKSIFLFGHVPVPYSGALHPDGHSDHIGAWPADCFYGDVNGLWTDVATYITSDTPRPLANRNIAGDGKYDPSSVPGDGVELQVGRVDLSDLPAFTPRTETDLLRQYLAKDHNFRQAALSVQRRGLVDDQFGDPFGEGIAANGWRNFAPMFGTATTQVVAGPYFATLGGGSYLWSYAAGGGNFDQMAGVGRTADFAATDVQTVFTMLFGSYFGDWDTTNNLLRGALASSSYTLTSFWGARPNWFLHHLVLGAEIGYAAKLAQNNNGNLGPYFGGIDDVQDPAEDPPRAVHIALHGDPTLRMHPVVPATDLRGVSAKAVALDWQGSSELVVGYYVYRAAQPGGPFTRLSALPVQQTHFVDMQPLPSGATYMVRALKLEQTASGSYYNLSQGAFWTQAESDTLRMQRVMVQPDGAVQLIVSGPTSYPCALQFSVDLRDWTRAAMGTNTSGLLEFLDRDAVTSRFRAYRAVIP
ncbi:MAG: fibronectin type III domain-containing protein [Kiritimatiellia bacterium]